jgi:V8-like Glu-specific endopeptidase
MATQDQIERRAALRAAMDTAQAEGRPVPMPDLRALGFAPSLAEAETALREGGVEAPPGVPAPVDYSAVLETICGVTDDSQAVELYDGTLGVSTAFVARRQPMAAQVRWNAGLGAIYTNPGTVTGPFGSGTMVSDDLFLTCGHLFDPDTNGWVSPRDNVTGQPIPPAEAATNMHVAFNFQNDAAGNPRPVQTFAIAELLEFRLGGLDVALCRLDGNPGQIFGRTAIRTEDTAVGDMLAIIGHPAGVPKRVEAGPATAINGDAVTYNDIDTLGGNSGSGILHEASDSLVGIHTNGGCNAAGTGANSGVRIGAALGQSQRLRNLAHAGRWVARHGLDGGAYQQAFDAQGLNGYRLTQVDAAESGNGLSYAALWNHVPGPAFVARHGITGAEYQAEFDRLVPQGFRPTCVSGAALGGDIRYAALFEQDSSVAWVARHGIDGATYQAEFDRLVPQGFRPRFVSPASVNGQLFYACVFEQRGGPAFVARHGITGAEYQAEFDRLVPQGFRPVWVDGAESGGDIRYAVIFEQRGDVEWSARHGLSSADYQAEFDRHVAAGFRPVMVTGSGFRGQVFYAAIFERR